MLQKNRVFFQFGRNSGNKHNYIEIKFCCWGKPSYPESVAFEATRRTLATPVLNVGLNIGVASCTPLAAAVEALVSSSEAEILLLPGTGITAQLPHAYIPNIV